MKTTSNFYYTIVFLFIFNFVSQNVFSQTDSLSLSKINKELQEKQAQAVNRFIVQGYKKKIEAKDGSISELVGETDSGNPMYYQTHNANITLGLKADVLQNGFDGLNATGLGQKIGLWEYGQPRSSHEMFRTNVSSPIQSRIEFVNDASLPVQRHATHIAGTIIGNQFQASSSSPNNALIRGLAYESKIKAWDWNNVAYEMNLAASIDKIQVGNTSFGFNPLYLHASEFGRYGATAQSWDDVMCKNNLFQIVKSVGNARDDFETNGYPQYPQVAQLGGYDLLEGAGIAKNILVVGSVNLIGASQFNNSYQSININVPYSSWGPTDDGRIKPDFVTHGNTVFSSIDTQNNTYGYYSGTSQAAAGITGGIALLNQYWNFKFPTPMWSSTLRSLLIHSIDEIDERGPDYRNGWGVVNLQKAANYIQKRGTSVIIREDKITNNQILKLNLAATGKEDLKVTIAWNDPAGNVVPIDLNNPNASINEIAAKLVNDLDIRLIRKDINGNDDLTLIDPLLTSPNDNVLFPWILKNQIKGNSSATLAAKAQRGVNDRDNVEKIEVDKNFIPATGGMFQLQISHKGTLTNACNVDGQPFSVVISGVSFCTDDLVFQQNMDNELYDAAGTLVLSNTIKASNVIKTITPFQNVNADFVEYQAEDFIELLPQSKNGGTGNEGFTAEYGSDFLAHIPCEGTNARMAFSQSDIDNFINNTDIIEAVEVEKGEVIVFPNPYINDILNIQYSLITSSGFSIEIYDISGKLVYKDNDQKVYEAGVHRKSFDANFLSTGVYIIRTVSSDGISAIKLIKK